MTNSEIPGPGAIYLGNNRCSFCVWAPLAQQVEVHLLAPDERYIPLTPGPRGYHTAVVDDVAPGSRYLYRLDGEKERPDPASRSQPESVHTASEVVDPSFAWSDTGWTGLPLHDYIIYEMHIGTFTEEGTFDAVIPHLDMLKDQGITALELLPVAQFPGNRNWGYDGVYVSAVQHSYGGPDGLKRLVDACHQRGLAVVLDVVYNHLGPEGNYLWDYAPYFTSRYQTPWGAAVNFDGEHNDEVRRFFIESALRWVDEFHIDALRLDAVHAITDFSAQTFLSDLATEMHRRAEQLGRRIYAIAESDQNDPRLLRPRTIGGFGLDGQWSDDFHHAIHTLLTGENDGYYEDFGSFEHIVRVWQQGWFYAGNYSIHRHRRHGGSPRDIPAGGLVVCTQNHDQVGNRMLGDRLSTLVSFDALKLAASTMLLSPYLPMLFMGEEYGEPAPFLYFVSHGDPDLVEAVRKGRKAEFSSFAWKGEPPDPQSEETFARSRLDHSLRQQGKHRVLSDLYRELIRLRKTLPALANLSKEHMEVQGFEPEQTLFVRRWIPYSHPLAVQEGKEVVCIFHYHTEPATLRLPIPAGQWRIVLDTSNERWNEQPQTTPPPEPIVSSGHSILSLKPYAALLLVREEAQKEDA